MSSDPENTIIPSKELTEQEKEKYTDALIKRLPLQTKQEYDEFNKKREEELNKRMQIMYMGLGMYSILMEKKSNEDLKRLAANAKDNELIQGAVAYALNDIRFWPWEHDLWKGGDIIKNLSMAAVLLSYHIEKIAPTSK